MNLAEISSICLAIVSASLDTVLGNLIMELAYLSSEHGQEVQQCAYEETMKIYANGDGWEKCLVEEKFPFITALVKEVLRYWTAIPICLPRVSIKDILYRDPSTGIDTIIPADSTFYMNSYSADYAESHFKDPHKFIVERYLNVEEGSGTPHYA